MRNLLRRSSLLIVGLLLTTTLLGSDLSAEPAGASTLRPRPTTASGGSVARRSAVRRPYLKPRRGVTRPYRARGSRSAVRPRVVRPKAVQAKAIPTGDVWARLRQCESGGNYSINTGNGFFGAYQFVPRTWRGLGFPGMPHQAPPEMQDEAARKLQARSGWGQWPACSRRLGLR